ncbi:hypothetical protein JJB98_23475 [Bradyrhizobium diazoefficiens]|nr:hypothetical protein [Bradyrhizobium diazoefficiens]QQO24833.1 hypothetical protein JJB98_23475 [Bradyrhizobium diazoefficiens]
MATYNILILGASYGSLLASKILFGGHSRMPIRLAVIEPPADPDFSLMLRRHFRGESHPVSRGAKHYPVNIQSCSLAR